MSDTNAAQIAYLVISFLAVIGVFAAGVGTTVVSFVPANSTESGPPLSFQNPDPTEGLVNGAAVAFAGASVNTAVSVVMLAMIFVYYFAASPKGGSKFRSNLPEVMLWVTMGASLIGTIGGWIVAMDRMEADVVIGKVVPKFWLYSALPKGETYSFGAINGAAALAALGVGIAAMVRR
jgi:hypothetical protein